MPTARELLEQADALMRRNRAAALAVEEIPELTDEIPVAVEAEANDVQPSALRSGLVVDSRSDDVPELTDAVAYVDAVSIEEPPEDDAEVSRWFESELGGASVTGPAPDSIAVAEAPVAAEPSMAAEVPRAAEPPVDADTPVEGIPQPSALVAPDMAESTASIDFEALEESAAVPSPPPSPVEAAFDEEIEAMAAAAAKSDAAETERWATLAEEIRMQVLQRIDIFTDTGLQQQLTARLQPIVDRASADLVAAINQHVGTLLRAYVAEAIEREIEKWRQDGR